MIVILEIIHQILTVFKKVIIPLILVKFLTITQNTANQHGGDVFVNYGATCSNNDGAVKGNTPDDVYRETQPPPNFIKSKGFLDIH